MTKGTLSLASEAKGTGPCLLFPRLAILYRISSHCLKLYSDFKIMLHEKYNVYIPLEILLIAFIKVHISGMLFFTMQYTCSHNNFRFGIFTLNNNYNHNKNIIIIIRLKHFSTAKRINNCASVAGKSKTSVRCIIF